MTWLPSSNSEVALVLDLPGAEGVNAGVAAASCGYRPVPLYNAVPSPFFADVLSAPAVGAVAEVDLLPVLGALKNTSLQLAELSLPSNAPPAFLLDSNRHGSGLTVKPGEFDNRSICFTTDFPSANFMLANGIRRVLVIQRSRIEPLSDLAYVLRRWQDGGIALQRAQVDFSAAPQPFEIRKPSWYGAMFQRALAAVGLRRAGSCGFGAWVATSAGG
ncbi:MAG TPA: hypothetical protein VG938_10540 [Verrucomicrobiae bacterium]|nr:hypothetical protein [Verrucomicrobiae bacterium]